MPHTLSLSSVAFWMCPDGLKKVISFYIPAICMSFIFKDNNQILKWNEKPSNVCVALLIFLFALFLLPERLIFEIKKKTRNIEGKDFLISCSSSPQINQLFNEMNWQKYFFFYCSLLSGLFLLQ